MTDIDLFRLVTLSKALRLELVGMQRSRRPSAYTIVKRELGFKGTKGQVLRQLEEHIFKLRQGNLDFGDNGGTRVP